MLIIISRVGKMRDFDRRAIFHGEKLRTHTRIKRVDLKNICKQNGKRFIIDLYSSNQKIVIYVSREAKRKTLDMI